MNEYHFICWCYTQIDSVVCANRNKTIAFKKLAYLLTSVWFYQLSCLLVASGNFLLESKCRYNHVMFRHIESHFNEDNEKKKRNQTRDRIIDGSTSNRQRNNDLSGAICWNYTNAAKWHWLFQQLPIVALNRAEIVKSALKSSRRAHKSLAWILKPIASRESKKMLANDWFIDGDTECHNIQC